MARKKKIKDFAKVKLKVGKKLKKTTQTDTSFSTKKIILVEQLARVQGEHLSHRGLPLDELCRQLGHYNVNVRKDAITGVRQLLASHPNLIPSHLHTLIPAIARLISDDKAEGDFRSQLKALLELLCQAPSLVMSSHFELFLAHVLLALTHLKLAVRVFAVLILLTLLRKYPDLCRNRTDLFDALTTLLSSQRRPANKQLLIDAVIGLMNVFVVEEERRSGPHFTASFSTEFQRTSAVDLSSRTPNFNFSVLGPSSVRQLSPLQTREGILKLFSAVCPILESLLTDEKSTYDETCAEIASTLAQVVSSMQDLEPDSAFVQQITVAVNPFAILVAKRRSSKSLKASVEALRTACSSSPAK